MGKKKGKKKKSEAKQEEAPAPVAVMMDDAGDEFIEPTIEVHAPADQLQLTEAELDADQTRVLRADDPNLPHNITRYLFSERQYKVAPPGPYDQLAIHLSIEGSALHVSSDDAIQQAEDEKRALEEAEERKRAAAKENDGEIDEQFDDGGKNQFNYSERAAQTFNNPLRERGVETEPPPVVTFSATVSQWDIYDSYMEQFEMAQREAEMAKAANQKGKKGKKKKEEKAPVKEKEEDVIHSERMGKSLKVLERMVNQNAEDEIYQDFKYWEDQSDQFREGEGSLLPLWRFSTERTKRKQVSSIAWNPAFPDLFAVGYGSYDFMRQGSGMVCCFSLKNTSSPEYTFSTESGVMCLDFHPQHHALLAVGCYDGTVMVFDVRNKVNKPIYVSSIKTGKHTDPVWQVVWQDEDIAQELNFFSISSDGRVANWVMSQNGEFTMETVMSLKLVSSQKDDADEETSLTGLAGGCCIDFNRVSEHLFIVGTEEGKIHKCSKAYSGQYLETYEGHHMAVYAVRWNPFHPRVFVSCSADWTVKLWDHSLPYPIMSFDLFNAVGDVNWSAYSSTVFSACTSDGKVHVFDLAENKHEPLCEQKVVKRARLTHVIFNVKDPIILVGDDRGGVNSLKLSPNLRKISAPPADAKPDVVAAFDKKAVEIAKIDKLLNAADAKPPSE